MTNLLFLTVGTVALLAGGWRVLRLINRGGPRGLAVTLVALGAALVLLAESVQRFESAIYPSLGRLASNVCTLTAAYGLLMTVSELSGEIPSRRRRRIRLGGYLAAALILAVTFFATEDLPSGLGLFGELYGDHATLLVYIVVYTLYLAAAVASIARIIARSLPPSRGTLRAGLVSLLAGCLLALAYLVDKVVGVWQSVAAVDAASPVCSNPIASVSCALSVAAPAVSILVSAVGVTLIAVGARYARRQALADLALLDEAVLARVPELARHRAASGSGDLLVQTVVGIRDGFLQLGVPDDPPEWAARALWHSEHPSLQAPPSAEPPGMSSTVWTEVERLRPVARAYADLTGVPR